MADRDYAELINLAAEMVRGTGMPSPYHDDWRWYVSTCQSQKGVVLEAAEAAHEQCKQWAIRLRTVADRLAQQRQDDSTISR